MVNLAFLGNDAGASATTIRNWISVLKASYMLTQGDSEVDLIIREKGVISPVGIKSAETFNMDFKRDWSVFRHCPSNRQAQARFSITANHSMFAVSAFSIRLTWRIYGMN